MKKNICIVCVLALMLCGLCACSRTPPDERAMSIAKEKLGLDLSGKCTVEELYYTYDNGNIFGEGTAEYRLSFDGDASGLFSSLDTLPDINGNDAVRKAAAMDGIYLPEPEDGTPFAYTSKNNELNWVLLLYYSEENTAYMITCDA